MSAYEIFVGIKDHGIVVDKKKARIRCNYCDKIVNTFQRLRLHLGGVQGDVTPCPEVPENVKQLFRNDVYQRMLGKITRELDLSEELPRKRKCSLISHGCVAQECSFFIRKEERVPTRCADEVGDDVMLELARKIDRFFYQNLIDVDAVDSVSFREMMCSAMGSIERDHRLPSSQQLKGNMFQAELTEIKDYVRIIKQSWSSTGCSIVLDAWTDEQGRELITFLVDCPQGPIYLYSSNVSNAGDLKSMINKVIEEVGTENVVQIVACSTLGRLGDVSKQFMNECRTVFWSVSASHCIELMLEKISSMGSVQPVMEKTARLVNFIAKLVRNEDFTLLDDFNVACLNVDSMTTAFTSLDKIVAGRDKLAALITLFELDASALTSMEEVKQVVDLVWDSSFWADAMTVLKATRPLVWLLSLIRASDKPFVGYIYETMDLVKEAIGKGFKNIESQYMPFWKVIDEIWDEYLHSPLHAAGYYLNPGLFYSTNFSSDSEVAFGLLCCIVYMVRDQNTQDKISLQLDKYRQAQGAFRKGRSSKCRMKPPLEWWSMHGRECPELQRFATRVLSQTCDGPLRYGLRREMAQRVLESDEMKCVDPQELSICS